MGWAFVYVGILAVVIGLVFALARGPLGRSTERWRRRMAAPNVKKYTPPASTFTRIDLGAGIFFMTGGVVLVIIGLVTR